MFLLDREVIFQLSPNGLYYFDVADRENSVLLLNMVSEKGGSIYMEGLRGGSGSAESDAPTRIPVGAGL